MNIILTIALFLVMNLFIWFSTNYQLTKNAKESTTIAICLALSIPISLCAYYGTKYAYAALESAWSARLLAFGVSYAVFPVLTYVFLNESLRINCVHASVLAQ